jgi:thiamine-phosphate pyrophosphorylase
MEAWMDLSLYLITDRHLTGGKNLLTVLEQAIQGGVRAIQLREKDLSAQALYELARQVCALTLAHDVALFVNDRVDVALAVGADGVHLGQGGLDADVARRIVGRNFQIGVSAHSLTEAQRAERKGADFVTFSPVFSTPSKTPYGSPVGVEKLAEAKRMLAIPVVGLGGIKVQNADQVLEAGVDGISVVSAIISSDDPCVAARELYGLIEMHKG